MSDEPEMVEQDADLKASLIAKADHQGVKIDKRWSAARIEEAIAQAAMAEPLEEAVPVPASAPVPPASPDAVALLMAQIEELKKMVAAQPATATPALTSPTAGFTPAMPPEIVAIMTPSKGTVQCRVTKAGDQKIHTGLQNPVFFKWADVIHLPPDIAQQLEDRQCVEIGAPNPGAMN